MADPTLEDQQSMTHGPEQPGPLKSFFDYAQQPAPPAPPSPWQEKINQAITRQDPRYVPMQPPQQQNWQQWIETAVSNLPFGFIGAAWTPRDLGILKTMYGANVDANTFAGLVEQHLPGRSISSVRQKAFQLGLNRPEIPPYVRQPGSPSIANDPARVSQINEMIKKNMTFDQMAAEMGDTSARSIRRYVNENLKTRLVKKSDPSATQPSMPRFNLPEESAGDPEYEKALAQFLQGQKGYARGGIVKEKAMPLGRGVMHYADGTDNVMTGVVPKQALPPAVTAPPPSLPPWLQQGLQSLQGTPRAAPPISLEQLQQLNQLLPQPQPATPPVRVPQGSRTVPQGVAQSPESLSASPVINLAPSSSIGNLATGHYGDVLADQRASAFSAWLAQKALENQPPVHTLEQIQAQQRAHTVASEPSAFTTALTGLFGNRQDWNELQLHRGAAQKLADPAVQQTLISKPEELAKAEKDRVAYANDLPATVTHDVSGTAGAGSQIAKPVPNPAEVKAAADATGTTAAHANPFVNPHMYTNDELVHTIANMPKWAVHKLFDAQVAKIPGVAEQITKIAYTTLEADYAAKKKAWEEAVLNKSGNVATLLKQMNDAHNVFSQFILSGGFQRLPYTGATGEVP